VAVWKTIQIIRTTSFPKQAGHDASRWSVYMIDLMAVIGFVGALSIWPAKIGVLYALFIFLALFALSRMSNRQSYPGL
jgi:hypothetical protein